jgi:type IV pilus modification protein PilV
MNDKGFTVIEVIVAIIILSVGILGLASSAATVTRMIGQGQRFSEASAMASERFEILRAQQCEDMDGGDETKGMFEIDWEVSTVNGTQGNMIEVIVTSPTGIGERADTFVTVVSCN